MNQQSFSQPVSQRTPGCFCCRDSPPTRFKGFACKIGSISVASHLNVTCRRLANNGDSANNGYSAGRGRVLHFPDRVVGRDGVISCKPPYSSAEWRPLPCPQHFTWHLVFCYIYAPNIKHSAFNTKTTCEAAAITLLD